MGISWKPLCSKSFLIGFAFDGCPADDRMPYGTAKARTGVPDEWIIDRLALGKDADCGPFVWT